MPTLTLFISCHKPQRWFFHTAMVPKRSRLILRSAGIWDPNHEFIHLGNSGSCQVVSRPLGDLRCLSNGQPEPCFAEIFYLSLVCFLLKFITLFTWQDSFKLLKIGHGVEERQGFINRMRQQATIICPKVKKYTYDK